jgi:hypothetical protein
LCKVGYKNWKNENFTVAFHLSSATKYCAGVLWLRGVGMEEVFNISGARFLNKNATPTER